MARFLVLDWDHQQLHVVLGSVGRGTFKLERAEVWPEEHPPNLAEAEALGQKLRERLKAAGIPVAPVLACIGRDRVILKDLRIPTVPLHEEPAIVRFQAVKELTDSPDEVIIDYTTSAIAGSIEKRALALIMRRELLGAYQVLCKAAGLKLAGLAPRAFGIAACLSRMVGSTMLTPPPEPADAPVAVLSIAERWAEFCVCRGDTLLYVRSLSVGPTLAGEIRRNLAVYSGQAAQTPVKAVYVAGGAEHATFREKLQDSLGIPVHSFDPVAGTAKLTLPDGTRGGFAGAVGLLHAQVSKQGLPINFVAPKEPKAPKDPNRKRILVGGGIAAAVLVILGGLGYGQLYVQDKKIERSRLDLVELENKEKLLQPDAQKFDAVQTWVNSYPNWLEELYDTTALFPEPTLVRLTDWSGTPHSSAGKDKLVFPGQLTLKGVTTQIQENRDRVTEFWRKLTQDNHYKVGPIIPESSTRGGPATRNQYKFRLVVETKKLEPEKYIRHLEIKPVPRQLRGFPGGPDIEAMMGGQP